MQAQTGLERVMLPTNASQPIGDDDRTKKRADPSCLGLMVNATSILRLRVIGVRDDPRNPMIADSDIGTVLLLRVLLLGTSSKYGSATYLGTTNLALTARCQRRH